MTYYFLTEELGKKLRAAIDKNEDLSSIFNSQKYKDERASWWLFQYDLGDMVFYAITQDKTESAKSILEHIQSQESQKFHYSKWAKELLAAYNKDKQIAIRVIDFAKKHDILQHLFEDLHDDIRAVLLKKDHGKYVNSSGEMVELFKQKYSYKGESNGESDTGTIIYSPAIICVGLAILCAATTSGEPNPSQKAMLTGLVAFAGVAFVLTSTILLCCCAASSIADCFSNRERNNIVKELQKQSKNQQQPKNQQKSQPQNAVSSVTEIAGPQTDAGITT